MDFTIPPRVSDLRDRIDAFVESHPMPLEADPAAYDAHENIALHVLERMREKGRAEGLWCLQLQEKPGPFVTVRCRRSDGMMEYLLDVHHR